MSEDWEKGLDEPQYMDEAEAQTFRGYGVKNAAGTFLVENYVDETNFYKLTPQGYEKLYYQDVTLKGNTKETVYHLSDGTILTVGKKEGDAPLINGEHAQVLNVTQQQLLNFHDSLHPPVQDAPAQAAPAEEEAAPPVAVAMPVKPQPEIQAEPLPAVQAPQANPLEGLHETAHLSPLKRGANKPGEVEKLQGMLKDMGYGKLLGAYGSAHDGIDDKFGPATEHAVKAFQQSHGLQPTGQVDEKTIKALEESHAHFIAERRREMEAAAVPATAAFNAVSAAPHEMEAPRLSTDISSLQKSLAEPAVASNDASFDAEGLDKLKAGKIRPTPTTTHVISWGR